MEEKEIQKDRPRVAREDPEMIGEETFESGKPDEPYNWRGKLVSREEILNYLKTALRYWYGESFGSERRKSPA